MEPIRNPHFMQTIVAENLWDGNLEIPRSFVQLHGKDLPPYACLQVPTGTMWRVEIKKDDGRVWLDKGWQTFVEDCAVKCGYSLMFKYEKGSFFQVIVCKTDHSEIIYPNQRIIRDQPRVAYISGEAGDDDSFVEISPLTRETDQSNGDGEVNQGRGVAFSSARDEFLQRVMNFECFNPHFHVIVTPSCQSNLCIPSPAEMFFHDGEGKDMCVNGPDGKAWHMKFRIEGSPSSQVVINSGWIEFAQNYRLQDGDACIFEMINSTVNTFKVTTFQIGGGGGREVDMSDHVGLQSSIFVSDQSSQALNKNLLNAKPSQRRLRRGMSRTSAPAAPAARVAPAGSAKKAKSSQISKTSFSVLHRPGRTALYKLFVPAAHASTYLVDQPYRQVFLHGPNGKTWRLECCTRGKTAFLQAGWRDFVEDNDLQVGDTCLFEMISQGPNHYNVTINRATPKLTEECVAQVSL